MGGGPPFDAGGAPRSRRPPKAVGSAWPKAAVVAAFAAILMGHLVAMCEGRPALADMKSPRQLLQAKFVAGGTDAPCGRYTYMVSINDRTNNHKCGGVLVHPKWVLTAAHCVDPRDAASAGATPVVVIGACDLNDTDSKGKKYKVELTSPIETIIHEDWTGDVTEGHDIALLKLNAKSKNTPVALPTAIDDTQASQNLVALGWGEQDGGEGPGGRLQQAASLNLVRPGFCNASVEEGWDGLILDSMLCAFSFQGQAVCRGDSGGPLLDVFNPAGDIADGDPSLDVVLGVTSFGDDAACGESVKPSVFTKVATHREWIDVAMGLKKSAKKSPAPDTQEPQDANVAPAPVASPEEEQPTEEPAAAPALALLEKESEALDEGGAESEEPHEEDAESTESEDPDDEPPPRGGARPPRPRCHPDCRRDPRGQEMPPCPAPDKRPPNMPPCKPPRKPPCDPPCTPPKMPPCEPPCERPPNGPMPPRRADDKGP